MILLTFYQHFDLRSSNYLFNLIVPLLKLTMIAFEFYGL